MGQHSDVVVCRLVISCSISMDSQHGASLMPRQWNGFALEVPAFAWYSNGLKRWMAVGARRLEEDIRRQIASQILGEAG